MLALLVRLLILVSLSATLLLGIDGELAVAVFVGLGALGWALPAAVDSYVMAALLADRKKELVIALGVLAASVGGGHALLGATGGDVEKAVAALGENGSWQQGVMGGLVGVLLVVVLWRVKTLGAVVLADRAADRQKKADQAAKEKVDKQNALAEAAERRRQDQAAAVAAKAAEEERAQQARLAEQRAATEHAQAQARIAREQAEHAERLAEQRADREHQRHLETLAAEQAAATARAEADRAEAEKARAEAERAARKADAAARRTAAAQDRRVVRSVQTIEPDELLPQARSAAESIRARGENVTKASLIVQMRTDGHGIGDRRALLLLSQMKEVS